MGQVLLPASLETAKFSDLVWQNTLESAYSQNYHFLFCPFDVSYQEISSVIASHGGTIGDILVTFSLDCSGLKKRKMKYQATQAEFEDLPGIIDIARKSFRDSRFFKDSHFDRVKAQQFYPSWLKESFYNSEKILVLKQEKQILGFISLKPDSPGETLMIRLIAVDDCQQGKGFGQILIDQAINVALDQNFRRLQAGTQLTNRTAINLYEKNGFRLIDAKYRYHIWLKQMTNVQLTRLGESLH
jgi:Acetyltransferases